jgi:hypothetical protein
VYPKAWTGYVGLLLLWKKLLKVPKIVFLTYKCACIPHCFEDIQIYKMHILRYVWICIAASFQYVHQADDSIPPPLFWPCPLNEIVLPPTKFLWESVLFVSPWILENECNLLRNLRASLFPLLCVAHSSFRLYIAFSQVSHYLFCTSTLLQAFVMRCYFIDIALILIIFFLFSFCANIYLSVFYLPNLSWNSLFLML